MTAELSAVPYAPTASVNPEIPSFEGETVVATKAKVTSVAGLDVEDRSFHMDETIKLVVECRVTGVDHKINAKGELERHHVLKAIDSIVIDWELDMDALREALKS